MHQCASMSQLCFLRVVHFAQFSAQLGHFISLLWILWTLYTLSTVYTILAICSYFTMLDTLIEACEVISHVLKKEVFWVSDDELRELVMSPWVSEWELCTLYIDRHINNLLLHDRHVISCIFGCYVYPICLIWQGKWVHNIFWWPWNGPVGELHSMAVSKTIKCRKVRTSLFFQGHDWVCWNQVLAL